MPLFAQSIRCIARPDWTREFSVKVEFSDGIYREIYDLQLKDQEEFAARQGG